MFKQVPDAAYDRSDAKTQCIDHQPFSLERITFQSNTFSTHTRQWAGMSNSFSPSDNDFPYNHSLAPLESLLAGVKRPGSFCVHGALALPMPMVRVDGVGALSFPLPPAQIAALLAAAERAPYGRGEQTVVDTSVRRVWQIDAARVRISGKSWTHSMGRILAETGRGLGCEDAAIHAELYKLLVYDPGGFFLAHHDAEVAQAARLIVAAFSADHAPRKLAWLLAHQYSQAELGFAALKGVDVAVVGVLYRAADAAACDAHLGVVHIEESGPAEVHYVPSRGRRYRDNFDEEDAIDATGVAYEVVEVSDTDRYIDSWFAAGDTRPALGRLPLGLGELLPAGALDDEPPDEDRLLESTGNEGVSFERAYRRAALILWPRARQMEVLLQAGVGSALPMLEEALAAASRWGNCSSHWSHRRSRAVRAPFARSCSCWMQATRVRRASARRDRSERATVAAVAPLLRLPAGAQRVCTFGAGRLEPAGGIGLPLRGLPGAAGLRAESTPARAKIALFRSLFRGRDDLFARRFESRATGSSPARTRCPEAGSETSSPCHCKRSRASGATVCSWTTASPRGSTSGRFSPACAR